MSGHGGEHGPSADHGHEGGGGKKVGVFGIFVLMMGMLWSTAEKLGGEQPAQIAENFMKDTVGITQSLTFLGSKPVKGEGGGGSSHGHH